MLTLFSHISTWLFMEIIATLMLAILNMIIPILMIFTSYRNVVNFYISSTALSSSLINCLYLFYLIQTFRSKLLSENNCRAIYYLQTSCIFVLAYTVIAMHANFVLCLLPSSLNKGHSNRTCLQSFGQWLRRFFRRFCFFLVVIIWSLSFTATIPLLYSIDSNEKSPQPVYCPGTKKISYLEEWFDRNRLIQTILCNLIPLLISLILSIIALSKLFYDFCSYLYLRLKMSQCLLCRKFSSNQQQIIPNSMLSSINIISNDNIQNNINLTITNDISALTIQSFRSWFSTSFLRFLLVSSCCLLACIYPIVMRFYLIYFSVLIPLIFVVFNYSLGQLTSIEQQQQQQTTIENRHTNVLIPPGISSTDTRNTLNMNINKLLQTKPIQKVESSNEHIELRSPIMDNLLIKPNESPTTQSSSSHSSSSHQQSIIKNKRKYFSNHLYENTRNIFMK